MVRIATHCNGVAVQSFEARPPFSVVLASFVSQLLNMEFVRSTQARFQDAYQNVKETVSAPLFYVLDLVKRTIMFAIFYNFVSLSILLIPFSLFLSYLSWQRQISMKAFSAALKILSDLPDWKNLNFSRLFSVAGDFLHDTADLISAVIVGAVVLLERLLTHYIPRSNDEPPVFDEEAFEQSCGKPFERIIWSLTSFVKLAKAVLWIRTLKPALQTLRGLKITRISRDALREQVSTQLEHWIRSFYNVAIRSLVYYRAMLHSLRTMPEYQGRWLSSLLQISLVIFDVSSAFQQYILAYLSLEIVEQHEDRVGRPVEPPSPPRIIRQRPRLPDEAHNPH